MFGYVLPERGELKIRELELYQSYYCGLCQTLKRKYHFLGQLSLNYDMTFLGMLLTALYEPQEEKGLCRCMVHPARKHPVVYNEWIDYAADMNILLIYFKCMDDWEDERKFTSLVYGKSLFLRGKKIQERYPGKAVCIQGYLDALSALERDKSENVDEMAGCFGNICAEMFACREDEWQTSLRRIGFFLGKFIYLLDAYDDYEEDLRKGCYNPLISYAGREGFSEWIYQILEMMIAEACREFEKLPIVEHIEILRNVLYAGVWCKYHQIRNAEKKCANGDKDDRPI